MLQSESGIEEISEEESCFFDFEEDEIFEQNIDDFDEAMDNGYDDGIAHSEPEDSYDEDLTDLVTEIQDCSKGTEITASPTVIYLTWQDLYNVIFEGTYPSGINKDISKLQFTMTKTTAQPRRGSPVLFRTLEFGSLVVVWDL